VGEDLVTILTLRQNHLGAPGFGGVLSRLTRDTHPFANGTVGPGQNLRFRPYAARETRHREILWQRCKENGRV
jgi:hypothetical protein